MDKEEQRELKTMQMIQKKYLDRVRSIAYMIEKFHPHYPMDKGCKISGWAIDSNMKSVFPISVTAGSIDGSIGKFPLSWMKYDVEASAHWTRDNVAYKEFSAYLKGLEKKTVEKMQARINRQLVSSKKKEVAFMKKLLKNYAKDAGSGIELKDLSDANVSTVGVAEEYPEYFD